MILGHFEPGGLILHLLCLCLEDIIVKRIVMYGKCILFIGGIVFLFFLFSSAAFVLVVFACLVLIGYQLIQQGHKQKAMKVEIKRKRDYRRREANISYRTIFEKYVCRQCTNDGSYL